MLNKWARIEELRLQEENLFEYKLMQKNGTLDSFSNNLVKMLRIDLQIFIGVWMRECFLRMRKD